MNENRDLDEVKTPGILGVAAHSADEILSRTGQNFALFSSSLRDFEGEDENEET
jgi:hypothetical protein